ncbi:MAG: serine/threonine protein kinase [Bacteroidales bacterium]|nr:serine/threonine protein kinase [Bacteroidales bacterium]
MVTIPDDSPLWDMLARWEHAARQGQEFTPEELARDNPALLPELREAIAALKATAWLDRPIIARDLNDDRLPTTRFGDYELLGLIGSGGMGRVYQARHRLMDRVVALKVLSRGTLAGADAERFQGEVRAAARLTHPNVVAAYDAGLADDGTPFLVMEFVDGPDFARVVREQGPLPVDQAVAVVLQAATALAYAHGQGILHLDVKPSNLLRGPDNVVKLLDLGLARRRDAVVPDAALMGTADYLAPERSRPDATADERADVYSLGATLFHLLAGRPPFGGSVPEVIQAHRDTPAPSLRQVRPDVPAGLDTLVQRMLSKSPGDRPQAMDDVVTALRPFLPGPSPGAGRIGHWIVIGVALAGGLGLLGWQFQGPALVQPGPAAPPAATPPRAVTASADSRLFNNTTDDIRAVAVSRDGKHVITGSFNKNMVRLWGVESADLIRSFPGHTKKVHGVALSSDGTLAASGGGDDDGTVRLWSVQTGDLVRVIQAHEGGVWSVAFDPEGKHLFSAGADKLIRMWAVDTGAEVRQFHGHVGQVFKLAVSPDGKHLLSGGADNRVFWWDVATGEPVYEFRGHATAVWAVAISPDSTRGLSGDQAGIIRLLDLTIGKEIDKWLSPTEAVFALAFHPSGKLALSGGGGGWRRRHDEPPMKPADQLVYAKAENNAITLWDVPTGRMRHHFNGHADAVWGLAFGPAGDWFVSGGRDKTLRLCTLPSE